MRIIIESTFNIQKKQLATQGHLSSIMDVPAKPKFTPFCSITPLSQQLIDKIALHFDDIPVWQAAEKVHGANFSVTVDETGRWFPAKRSGHLAEEEVFHDARSLLQQERNGEFLRNVLNLVRVWPGWEDVTVVHVFGELFGGAWPNKVGLAQRKAVQKGVFYSPDYHIIWYDVWAPKHGYAPAKLANALFDEAKVLWVRPIVIGSLQECLNAVDVEKFQSTLPDMLGCGGGGGGKNGGDLAGIDNRAEGTVIKPYECTRYFPDGSRLIIKNKRSDFMERKVKKNKPPKPEVKNAAPKDPRLASAVEDAFLFLTESRLQNVISHYGVETVAKWPAMRVVGLLTQDALKDFAADFGETHGPVLKDPDMKPQLNALVQAKAAKLVAKKLKSLLE